MRELDWLIAEVFASVVLLSIVRTLCNILSLSIATRRLQK